MKEGILERGNEIWTILYFGILQLEILYFRIWETLYLEGAAVTI